MAESRAGLEGRMLWASLARQRGPVALAVLAVAIGASVASALLHVSGDVGAKLTRELRVLGPNLVVVPARDAAGGWLDEAGTRAALAAAHADAALLLYAGGRVQDRSAPLVGADLAAAARLHPAWRLRAGTRDGALAGVRLARRLGLAPGEPVAVAAADGARPRTVRLAGVFESGGADDDALWLPLADVQALAGLPGRASLAQVRVDGGEAAVAAVAARLAAPGAREALPLHALSATEQGLLDRMRRLMALVTIAALIAGALSAYGTLTDLALERRREIALLRALGAPRRWIVGRFLAESVAIGIAGGALGWAIGAGFALLIGREVFHAALALAWSVPPLVLLLALLTALVAAAGPIRLALAIEPARVLKGE